MGRDRKKECVAVSNELKAFLDVGKVHQDWVDKFIAMSAWGRKETLYATAALTFKVLTDGIGGSLAECGVAAGAHPGIMHYCMRFCGKTRKIFLFDSFEGIPQATVEDIPTDENPGDDIRKCIGSDLATPGVMKSTGITAVSLPEVKERMARWGADEKDLVYVKGWFQNTVPVTDTGPLAILRLDGDLYESTKVCMDHLYEKLTPGGFCIVDDWELAGAKRAVTEYFEGDVPKVIKIPGGAGPIFWRKAVI